eukprot:gene17461-20835_t
MTIGVFAILGAFRLYVFMSSARAKRSGGGLGRRDSLADPLLLLKQMINTKPKKFIDIFPDELREIARRRVLVLKEKDPFRIASYFPIKRSTSLVFKQSSSTLTPPAVRLRNQVLFRTPQTLKSSSPSTDKDPSPLALSPSFESLKDIRDHFINDQATLNHDIPSLPATFLPTENRIASSPASSSSSISTNPNTSVTTTQTVVDEEASNFINEGPTIEPFEDTDVKCVEATQRTNGPPISVLIEEESSSDEDVEADKPAPIPTLPGRRIIPSVNHGLVGLALSGGGIRSATFNLGLLQALSKHKLFRRVDYLSTVSGGGFIGSCLISLLSEGTHTPDWHNFPFHYSRGMKEGVPLKHLRNSANYLANGIFEFLLFPVLILRGIVLNLMSIFPFVWCLLLFERHMPIQFDSAYYLTSRVAYNLLVHIIIFPLISRPKVTIPATLLFISIYSSELSAFFLKANNIEIATSLCLHIYLNHPWLLRREDSKVWYDRSFGWLFIVLIALAFVESLPLVENIYTAFFGGVSETSFRIYPLVLLFILILADSLAFTLLTNPKLAPAKRLIFHIIVSVIGPLLLILTYLELSVWVVPSSPLLGVANGFCLFASLLSFFTMDINETSMHKYYRDRLSKAYMFSIKNGRFRPYGGEKISRINRRSVAPYLLINTTLNYTTNHDLRGDIPTDSRGSDFFIFSQHFVGSETCGYRSTEQMERLDRRLDLATAVSISGAAVGTKMGTATIPTLVLSLGILNIRLGYWLPNPLGIFLSHPYLGRLFYGGFACYHLVKEFGWTHMTSKDWCINLSDGGHIENLGAYELIKRRYEDEVIKEYHSQHPSFPQESTTDQFFTESQFEAYRSLGYHIGGSSLFGPKHNRLFDGEDVEGFFERIYHSCTGELPTGWQEKRDDAGSQYFVQQDMKKKTWFDPRLRKKDQQSASSSSIPTTASYQF